MQRLLQHLQDWLAAWNAFARQLGIAEIRHVKSDDGTWQSPLHFPDHNVNAGPGNPLNAVHRPRRMAANRPRNHGVATKVQCVRNTRENRRCLHEKNLTGYEGEDYDCGFHD